MAWQPTLTRLSLLLFRFSRFLLYFRYEAEMALLLNLGLARIVAQLSLSNILSLKASEDIWPRETALRKSAMFARRSIWQQRPLHERFPGHAVHSRFLHCLLLQHFGETRTWIPHRDENVLSCVSGLVIAFEPTFPLWRISMMFSHYFASSLSLCEIWRNLKDNILLKR